MTKTYSLFELKALKSTDALARDRAALAIEEVEGIAQASIDTQKRALVKLKLEVQKLMDVAPRNAMDTSGVDQNFDAESFWNNIKNKQRQIADAELHLSIDENTYDSIFGKRYTEDGQLVTNTPDPEEGGE